MDDHYFGAIKPRVEAYMEDLNKELWKLGIFTKTEHNGVLRHSMNLHQFIPTTNIATDHNQLTMEMMQKPQKNTDLFVCFMKNRLQGLMAAVSTITGH